MKSLATLVALPIALWTTPLALSQDVTAITRVSENALGTGAAGGVGRPALAPNGRFVAFASTASNLVLGDSGSTQDIFERSFVTGLLRRVNVGRAGAEANGNSSNPAVSPVTPKGFHAVVYESNATNIARLGNTFPDTNDFTDIYVTFPKLNDFTERISIGPGPVQADGDSGSPSITIIPEPNRALVAYASDATNLTSSTDTNGKRDIFLATVRSIVEDGFDPASLLTTIRITNGATSGTQSNDDSFNPQISADGKFVVYESLATNLVSGGVPAGTRQIYRYEIASGTTTLVSKSSNGTPGDAVSRNANLSYSGNYVVYLTTSTNILSDGQSVGASTRQVVLYNAATGTSSRVNQNSLGIAGNGTNGSNMLAYVSADGRYVIFNDNADNLVADDTNSASDVFIRDFGLGTLKLISRSLTGELGNAESFAPTVGAASFTSPTALVSFKSDATNLISDDTENNIDAFNVEIAIPPVPLTKDTKLEVPPEITLTSDDIAIDMQEFDGAAIATPTARAGEVAFATSAPKLRYLVEARREGFSGKKADLRSKLVKRNAVSFRNLKSGTYLVRYRGVIKRGSRTVGKTAWSPTQRISTGEDA